MTPQDGARLVLIEPSDTLLWRLGMGRTAEILDIRVDSERRKGTGRKLISEAVKDVRLHAPETSMLYAITRMSNTIAHQFYEALGFRLVGRLHFFYRDRALDAQGNPTIDASEHAVVYGLDL